MFLDSVISIFLYLAVFFLSSWLVFLGTREKSVLSRIQRRAVVVVGVALPVIMGSVRYAVGGDYPSYLQIYLSVSNGWQSEYLQSLEPATRFFVLVSQYLTDSPVLFLAMPLAIAMILLYVGTTYFIKKEYLFAVWFIELLFFFPFVLNTVRQALAIAIVFFAVRYVIGRQWLAWTTAVGLAALCHQSALFLWPLYIAFGNRRVRSLLMDERSHRKMTIAVIVVAAAFFFLVIAVLLLKDGVLSSDVRYVQQLYVALYAAGGGTALLNLGIVAISIPFMIYCAQYFIARWAVSSHIFVAQAQYRFTFMAIQLYLLMLVPGIFLASGYRMSMYLLPFLLLGFAGAIHGAGARQSLPMLAQLMIRPVRVYIILFIMFYWFVGQYTIFPYYTVWHKVDIVERYTKYHAPMPVVMHGFYEAIGSSKGDQRLEDANLHWNRELNLWRPGDVR